MNSKQCNDSVIFLQILDRPPKSVHLIQTENGKASFDHFANTISFQEELLHKIGHPSVSRGHKETMEPQRQPSSDPNQLKSSGPPIERSRKPKKSSMD